MLAGDCQVSKVAKQASLHTEQRTAQKQPPPSISEPVYSKIPEWREASEEAWNCARWINGMAAARAGVIEEGKTIVCGHWHCSYGHSNFEGNGSEFGEDADFSPCYGNGIIALDACTGHSGKVNVIVVEDK